MALTHFVALPCCRFGVECAPRVGASSRCSALLLHHCIAIGRCIARIEASQEPAAFRLCTHLVESFLLAVQGACTFGPRLADEEVQALAVFVLDNAKNGWNP